MLFSLWNSNLYYTFNTLFTATKEKMYFWDISNGKCKYSQKLTTEIDGCKTSSDGNWIFVDFVRTNGTLLIFDFNGKLYSVIENIDKMDVWQNDFYVFDKFITNNMLLYKFKKV